MKIIVLSSHTSSLFWFRLDMMISFMKLGHQVIAVAPGDEKDWTEKFVKYNIKYKQIKVSRNGLNPFSDISTFFDIKRLLSLEKPDKIFVYQAKTIAYGCIAAKICGITEVYPMVGGLGSIFRGNGIKNLIVKLVMCKLYKIAFNNSKIVLFQNNDDRLEMVNHKLISLGKTAIINGSGVDLEKFVRTNLPDKPCFLYIGRLIRDKGVVEYLEACRIIHNTNKHIRCLLVGPFDSNPSALKEKELQPHIDAGIIEYFGEQSDVRPFIAQCSTYVLPSYHEGTPKTVLEAMAMGRAVLTSDAPGCRETVVDGKNGFLIRVKDIDMLVEKMFFLIDNPIINKQLGYFGRKMAERKYDVKKVNQSIIDIMELSSPDGQ